MEENEPFDIEDQARCRVSTRICEGLALFVLSITSIICILHISYFRAGERRSG